MKGKEKRWIQERRLVNLGGGWLDTCRARVEIANFLPSMVALCSLLPVVPMDETKHTYTSVPHTYTNAQIRLEVPAERIARAGSNRPRPSVSTVK